MLPVEFRLTEEDYEKFFESHPDERGVVKMMGKEMPTKRWFASYGRGYSFTGVAHEAEETPELVSRLMEWVNATPYGSEGPGAYNECLVNWYGDGRDYIGSHADDAREMVTDSPIVCISFGSERKFRVRRPNDTAVGPKWPIALDLVISDGTVYVMGGKMQEVVKSGRKRNPRYKHESPPIQGKKGEEVGSRISLTFRKFK